MLWRWPQGTTPERPSGGASPALQDALGCGSLDVQVRMAWP